MSASLNRHALEPGRGSPGGRPAHRL